MITATDVFHVASDAELESPTRSSPPRKELMRKEGYFRGSLDGGTRPFMRRYVTMLP